MTDTALTPTFHAPASREWSLDRIAVLLTSIAIVGTIFDAMLTYVGVHVYQVANELNTNLILVADVVGFGWTMVLRAVVGVALVLAMYGMTRVVKVERHKKLSVYALGLAAGMLTALAVYHIIMYTVRFLL